MRTESETSPSDSPRFRLNVKLAGSLWVQPEDAEGDCVQKNDLEEMENRTPNLHLMIQPDLLRNSVSEDQDHNILMFTLILSNDWPPPLRYIYKN